MVALTLPDGTVRAYEQPVTGARLAADIGPGLAKAALAARIDGELRDLKAEISKDASISIVTAKDEDGLELLRHDAAHVMAEAVKELYPETQVTIGPAIENGFITISRGPRPSPPRIWRKSRPECAKSSPATSRSAGRIRRFATSARRRTKEGSRTASRTLKNGASAPRGGRMMRRTHKVRSLIDFAKTQPTGELARLGASNKLLRLGHA